MDGVSVAGRIKARPARSRIASLAANACAVSECSLKRIDTAALGRSNAIAWILAVTLALIGKPAMGHFRREAFFLKHRCPNFDSSFQN